MASMEKIFFKKIELWLVGLILLVSFLFAVAFNCLWFMLGRRTKSTYDKMYLEFARLEGFPEDQSSVPEDVSNLFYWNVVRRPKDQISATFWLWRASPTSPTCF